jgi:hypothetical protein
MVKGRSGRGTFRGIFKAYFSKSLSFCWLQPDMNPSPVQDAQKPVKLSFAGVC